MWKCAEAQVPRRVCGRADNDSPLESVAVTKMSFTQWWFQWPGARVRLGLGQTARQTGRDRREDEATLHLPLLYCIQSDEASPLRLLVSVKHYPDRVSLDHCRLGGQMGNARQPYRFSLSLASDNPSLASPCRY